MFSYDPNMWIQVSATTILVLVAFSIAFFVLPFSPHILPMHQLKWAPCKEALTSLISKVSIYKSSRRRIATASYNSNPSMNALRKSAAFWTAPISIVSLHVHSSTHLHFTFILTCNFICFTNVFRIVSQLLFNGLNLWFGTGILQN